MSDDYYDVLILMRDGEWGVRVSKLALSTAQQYARDLVDPPAYAKRNPWPRDRIKIKRHDPAYDFVEIFPGRKPDMYPKRLADTPEQQREWDAEADRQCRPISDVLDVVAGVLEQFNPDEALPMKDEPERPF